METRTEIGTRTVGILLVVVFVAGLGIAYTFQESRYAPLWIELDRRQEQVEYWHGEVERIERGTGITIGGAIPDALMTVKSDNGPLASMPLFENELMVVPQNGTICGYDFYGEYFPTGHC